MAFNEQFFLQLASMMHHACSGALVVISLVHNRTSYLLLSDVMRHLSCAPDGFGLMRKMCGPVLLSCVTNLRKL